MKTFIDMCVKGTKKLEDIDNFIEEWHNSNSKIDLRKAIGLTKSQYQDFLYDDAFISDLILQEKAKQMFYKHWGWKRFFMSVRRKKRIIKIFLNTVKMMENVKNNPPKINVNLNEFTPEKLMDLVIETLPAPNFISEVDGEKAIYFPKIEVKDE